MYRPSASALLASLGLLAACGSEDAAPSGTTGDGGGGSPSVTGASTGVAGTTAPAGAGAPAGSGGSGNTSGSATGGVGPITAGAGGGNAGASPAAGSSAGGGTSASNEYWIATDGDDANPGTEAAPFATVSRAVIKAKPGVKLWLEPGTYKAATTVNIPLSSSGTASMPITLQAAPGARPVLDFSSQTRGSDSLRGINLAADYWHIKGLELKSASDNCIAIAGSNNVIEDVIVHECGDTGLQITAPSDQATDDTRAANNTILNCDSWGNLDSATGGENADGFAAKLRIGPGNVFRGCRAWNNADDGWDLFAADDVVKIDGCWAFSNGKPIGGNNPQGDGNGFKLGGAPNGAGQGGAVHLVTGSFAFENNACGFVRNNNPELPKLSGCGAKDNKTAYCSLSVSGEVTMTLSAAAARTTARNADGSLPAMK